MAKRKQHLRGERGLQGIPGPPGPRGPSGPVGKTGPTGHRGIAGRRGAKAKAPSAKSRKRIVKAVDKHIENIYRELDTQLTRLSKIQVQVDELREKIRQIA